MSDCCNNTENNNADLNNQKGSTLPRKFNCPKNEFIYNEVSKKTILQHIEAPWINKLPDEKYYFCEDPKCEIVYFGINGSVINKNQLRTVVGIKENSLQPFICYCFGVSKELAIQYPEIKAFVIQQTKEQNCACETRNPSGRCCLKDFD